MVRMRRAVLILMMLSTVLLFAVTAHAEHGDIIESARFVSTSGTGTR